MSELHQNDQNPAPEPSKYAELTDAQLTERICAGPPSADPAMQEIRRRHLPAVLSYARLCSSHQTAGNQLAAQAFALAWPDVRRGIDPRGTWRHHLLMLVQQAAETRAAGSLRGRLEPEFATWLDDFDHSAEDQRPEPRRRRLEERSVMLGGFYRLPERWQGILWYAVVDQEPDAEVATFLGLEPCAVAELSDLKAKAQNALREGCLRTYLQSTGDKKCQGFRRIMEAAVRPGDMRRSGDLDQHLAECPRCASVLAELTAMEVNPRTVLADGLLGWGGAAYVTAGPARVLPSLMPASAERPVSAERPAAVDPLESTAPPGAVTGSPAGPPPDDPPRHRRGVRSSPPTALVAVTAVALVAAVTALLAFTSGDPDPAGNSAEPPPPPAATVTATVSGSAPAAPPTATEPSKRPRPSPTPTAPTADPVPAPTPAPSKGIQVPPAAIPGDTYTQVINTDSGLCLDIEDGVLEKRTDVVMAECNGSSTQYWRLDSDNLLRSYADSDFCLDSRGDTDRGVGIWVISSADGENGQNLRFVIDQAGAIRPAIELDFAMTPSDDDPGSSLDLRPVDGNNDQHWTAGSAP
ncbi:ricin-type beta-trefoil lectin domain protein [Streptomyces sp. NPDC004647]|uniref:RICIN domain-containing protein n=1 Tax=Streptomyces sp. NPDC004647 TaxID=3154671 RepID=UPI0033BD69D1